MDMLEKLEALQEALTEYVNLSDYKESGLMESFMKENHALVDQMGPLPGAPALVDAMPVLPPDDTGLLRAKRDTETAGRNYKIALGVTIAGVVVGLLLKMTGLGSAMIVLGGIAAYMMNSRYKQEKKHLKEKENTYNQALKESQESIARFREALKFWDKDVEDGFAQAKQYKRKYQETYEKHTELLQEYVLRQQATDEMIQAKQEEIFSHDYIPAEYYRYVSTMITLLKSGRADSYKEALNMAISMEQEEQREERRIAAMERQAEEERRHNMAIERQQAEHNRAVEEHNRAMEKAEKDRAERERNAQNEAKKRAYKICSQCRLMATCRAYGTPNCGAFQPKN